MEFTWCGSSSKLDPTRAFPNWSSPHSAQIALSRLSSKVPSFQRRPISLLAPVVASRAQSTVSRLPPTTARVTSTLNTNSGTTTSPSLRHHLYAPPYRFLPDRLRRLFQLVAQPLNAHTVDWSIPRISGDGRSSTLEFSVGGTMLERFAPSRSLLSRRVVWLRSEWPR